MAQRRSAVSCTQGAPAGLPCGIPGIGLLIDGAMQQAAQRGRQAWPGSAAGGINQTTSL
ncbi:conserved hypothetical protein [Thiomonas arsenitoxydans]|uniref:Uncharacterized protein n=1 Tax=Thiomonas arsenitoxydans (strain DSM 22701 / CIP 110005 / 3As) TaxID=426114 RepID=D6CSI8_THIA3|nr:hypothetical protein THI_1578 [Thiomonas arsenitoxydans]CQR32902.1 conserved hypothetical protein [Thiomonas arsenitoxydans]CQR33165.1 conserved hypothetical protein [Thiomonas arsenitoxydans]CQR33772.1 conserved hypothetical protein [Thiomonas arsenitoxydans]CQR40153.1 conserved hypothetical protein [Thiomonas arsenitoxydans]